MQRSVAGPMTLFFTENRITLVKGQVKRALNEISSIMRIILIAHESSHEKKAEVCEFME